MGRLNRAHYLTQRYIRNHLLSGHRRVQVHVKRVMGRAAKLFPLEPYVNVLKEPTYDMLSVCLSLAVIPAIVMAGCDSECYRIVYLDH